ncbi:type-B DNA-directed DNA polymerase [Ordospora colligata]|uniref:DNA polymerase n=1 Tax=Ordospora colligata OC4 TaxID=1354746 RepID=A0A0B2UMI2_9MICR|nr:type-B DNA-directed DNA polymerase [Ordospora colligata OC4]KHN70499.1 type-B DNA-directed DNA polymerase [Ordospora colligata OC4]TBU17249.1 type-B DNA-directed DNA polymerase [Ordospora colligata]TBU17499.1 type-B DNA-directed DNA polymerase [Ordospora colligata]TBU19679.1 type-B DNA-directed DNA polymerase [Ordospora colligata]
MYFYLLHIDQIGSSSILLHGKVIGNIERCALFDAIDGKLVSSQVRVDGVHSPVFMKAADGRVSELQADIEAFMNRMDVKYVLENVKKQNAFYANLERHIDLIKVVCASKVSFDGFFSEYSDAIITEFMNPVENIIVSRGIRGPCVLWIDGVRVSGDGYVVDSAECVRFVCNSKLPELTIAALAVRANNHGINGYSLFMRGKTYDGVVRSTEAEYMERVERIGCVVHATPSSLLSHLNALIRKESVDCIVYHNLQGAIRRKLDIFGRIRCDVFAFASGCMKGNDYSIDELMRSLSMNDGQMQMMMKEKPMMEEGWFECLQWESKAIAQIFTGMYALQLSKEMSEISGYIMNRVFKNMRAERIEYTLLHELYARGYLFPPVMARKEVKYTGGLVLSPQIGFYEDIVLLLDFNSLYPSIIQEFNVCFSTIGAADRSGSVQMSEEQMKMLTEYSKSCEVGILPQILEGFVKRRKAVKELMRHGASPEEIMMLEVRQKALKLTANSMYGCLGSHGSRFCNYTMACYITFKGRELLMESKRIAEEDCGMKIVYGDTDSVMVYCGIPGMNVNYVKAIEKASVLKDAINGRYRNIEIGIEKVFKKLLLYKKKKYAGLWMDGSGGSFIEYKGLDLVRRDFCGASKKICKKVIELLLLDFEGDGVLESVYGDEKDMRLSVNGGMIMNDGNARIREMVYEELKKLVDDLQNLPRDEYVIYNTLSKAPEDYGASNALPHVSLALRLKEEGMKFDQGDVVCYVMGKAVGNESMAKKAYNLSECVEIDYEYYISSQILPAVLRILNVVKGFHADKINGIFGVESTERVEPGRNVSFLTPCCETSQNALPVCLTCSKPISEAFYVCKVIEMLRKEVSAMYNALPKCGGCGVLCHMYILNCFHCGYELDVAASNQEFDVFLSGLESACESLGSKEMSLLIRKHTKVSGYRRIDLRRYFEKEISRYESK